MAYSCPSVKEDVIKRRLCSSCGLYFGTIKPNTLHKASCRVTEVRTENVTERVRPMRIAARRQRELLCVMALQEMEWVSMDDVEGFDIENVDLMRYVLFERSQMVNGKDHVITQRFP